MSLFDFGKVIEDSHHIEVVLGAVQTNPRHHEPSGFEILVVRLMLVPEEYDPQRDSVRRHIY